MTPKERAVMQQALDALNYGLHVGFDESSESQIKKCTKAFQQSSNAIAALRQAISEAERADHIRDATQMVQAAEQEPVTDFKTWWQRDGQEFLYALNTTTDDDIKLVAEFAWNSAPSQREWKYDPETGEPLIAGWPLFSGLPQREWVSLTDDEIENIAGFKRGGTMVDFARAVIAAHKEKNK